MGQQETIALVEQHLKAEGAGDVEGAVAVYADDIVHDAVGFPGSPRVGKDAAREFYRFLTAHFRTEVEEPINRFFDANNMILEQSMTGSVVGEMFGIPGEGTACHIRHPARFWFPRRTDQPRTGLDRQRCNRGSTERSLAPPQPRSQPEGAAERNPAPGGSQPHACVLQCHPRGGEAIAARCKGGGSRRSTSRGWLDEPVLFAGHGLRSWHRPTTRRRNPAVVSREHRESFVRVSSIPGSRPAPVESFGAHQGGMPAA